MIFGQERCQIRLYFSHLSMQRRVAPFVEIALLSRAADVLILEMDTLYTCTVLHRVGTPPHLTASHEITR